MTKHDKKIEDFIMTQLSRDKNSGIMLLKAENNTYLLFGKYIITKEPGTFNVIVDEYSCSFGTIKTALAWCIFKEHNSTQRYKELELIDRKLAGLEVDTLQSTNILKKTKDIELTHIYNTKIQEVNFTKKVLLKKLNSLINTADKWQTRKYDLTKSKAQR
jgi:hypothetical protein